MAKTVQTQRGVNRKAIAALTLVVLLVLSAAFGFFGIKGQKLDKEGLYKLLPWIPTPTERFEWREALVPGADFGANTVYSYTVAGADQNAAGETAKALSKRLSMMKLTGASVEQKEDGSLALTLPDGALSDESLKLLTSVGDYSFADPDGVDFLSGSHIVKAATTTDQQRQNWFVSFELDAEGKKIFAEKTTELVGKSIMLKKDGTVLVNPGIQEPLTEGGASIPGFTFEQGYMHSLLMQSGKLPAELTAGEKAAGTPLMGEGTMSKLVMGMWCAFALVAVYLIVRYRLAGIVAAWTLALVLGFNWLFAALLKSGFTVATLVGVLASFALAVYGMLVICQGMQSDLRNGRAARQALKDSYASAGHIALDVYAAMLLLALVLIILNNGVIGQFMRVLAVGLIIDLVMIHILLRLLLSETFHLFGEKTALFAAKRVEKENA